MKLSKRPWLLIALAVCLFTLTGGFMTVGVTNDQQPSIGYYTDGGTASLPPLSFEQIHEVVSHATDLLAESGGFLDGIFAEEQLEGFKTTTTCLEITFPDTQTTELSKMGKQIQYDRLLFVFKKQGTDYIHILG